MTVRPRAVAASAAGPTPFGRRRLGALTLAVMTCCGALLVYAVSRSDGKIVDRFFPQAGASGGDGGQFNNPRDITINQAAPADGKDGWKYVVDQANNRIQAFNASNVFQWAIGRDVIEPGGAGNIPLNEQQTVTIGGNPTGGTFTLTWNPGTGNQVTAAIPFNAPPSGPGSVQAALEGLAALNPGDVAVTSANPGGGATAGGPYAVEFMGARADANWNQISGTPTGLTPAGGKTVTVVTNADGANVFEKCTVSTDCKAALSGSLGGMFNTPQGVAVNQGTGGFYVRDRANNRVQQFDADGAFVRAWGWDTITNGSPSDPGNVVTFQICSVGADCKAGVGPAVGVPTGAGQLALSSQAEATGLAINSTSGNVYVADPGNVTGDGLGKRVQEFESDGDFVRLWGWNVVLSGPGDLGASSFEICVPANGDACRGGDSGAANGQFAHASPRYLAIDAAGVLYASDTNDSNRVMRFDTTQTSPASFLMSPLNVTALTGGPSTSTETTGLSVGAGGNLLVARSADVGIPEIASPGGATPTLADTHLVGAGLVPKGVAQHLATSDLYVSSNSGGHRVYVLDDNGNTTPPDATIFPPLDIGANGATFQATINPQGFPTSYRFQYSRNGVDWTDAAANQNLGDGTSDILIDDAVTGLDASTTYRVRLVVTRGFGNGTVTSTEEVFLTDAVPPEIVSTSAGAIKNTSAILTGSINPHGTPTSYRFEYGEGVSYGNSVPVPDGTVGSGHAAKFVKQEISGLQADRTYHFRLVADSQTEGATVGPDQVFRTRTHAPDGRGLELVSPADKLSGGVGSYASAGFRGAGAGRPSLNGDRVAVQSDLGSPLVDAAFEYANSFAFCERASDQVGWGCHSPFTHPNYTPAARRFANISDASDDLSLMMWQSNGGHIGVFPELADYPNLFAIPQLSDWHGRWEVAGPTAVAQGDLGGVAVSPNGSHAVVQGNASSGYVGGLSGPDDPYFDRIDGGATYIIDVSHGLSDSFPGDAIREPIGVCTAGTEIPNVDGGGDTAGQACPPPVEYEPGKLRSAALISSHGTQLGSGTEGSDRYRISQDGSRAFFTDQSSGAPPACTGSGAATSCPPQLYVRQENADGSVSVRWISRPEVVGQDASLLAKVVYAGATPNGDKVFFTSTGPLTNDDRNGTGASPVTTGSPSATSNDLFMYDLPDGPDGDPATPDADPASGDLIRVSAGPAGLGDCNVGAGGARFISPDGGSVYFTCADDLAGTDVTPPAGGITTPDGTTTATATAANLYRYQHDGMGQWSFVAQLPIDGGINSCATLNVNIGGPLNNDEDVHQVEPTGNNCVRGTVTGDFTSFMTRGKLTSDDPNGNSADIYVFDADADRLTRATVVEGGPGGSYACVTVSAFDDAGLPCHAEMGGTTSSEFLDMVTAPATLGKRTVFFQSPLGLTPDDSDEEFDVYEWTDDDVFLFTPGTERDAYYTGNSEDGKDVFVEALDQLSHQDKDAVMDVYDARVGGGIPMPPPPRASCNVMADACQGHGADQVDAPINSGGGVVDENVSSGARNRLTIAALSANARRRAARSGVIVLRAKVGRPGTVTATARATLSRRTRVVARAAARVLAPGSATLRLRLNRAARQGLASGRRMRVSIAVSAPGAYERTLTVLLKRGSK